jgi:hypothetical protein
VNHVRLLDFLYRLVYVGVYTIIAITQWQATRNRNYVGRCV